MKVSELIKELERLAGEEDPEVIISIGSYFKSGEVTSEKIFQLNRYTGKEIRIQTSVGKHLTFRKANVIKRGSI